MKLFKYYRNSVLLPTLFVLTFAVFYAVFYKGTSTELSFKSLLNMSIIPALIYALIMCVICSTIFLNKIKSINKNLILNLVTWFLLPGLYLIIVFISDMQLRLKHEFGFGYDYWYLLLMTVPYLAGLILTFMSFRQQLLPIETSGKAE